MKTFRLLLGALVLIGGSASAQTSYFNQGFLRQPSAEADRAYLGIGTNGGSGTLTNFSMDNFSPLFNVTVTSPTLNPHVSLTPIAQAAHTFYAAPIVGGTPVFRTIDASDLPGGGGTVTSFSSGDLPPLFTTSVATPTTTPALSYNLTSQSANKVFAGPTGGGASPPTFRSLVSADFPFTFGDLTDAGTDGITVTGGTGAVIGSGTSLSQHVADSTHNGYLSSSDWNTFNNKGSGTLTGVTNASWPNASFTTLIANSNPPVPSFKSISAGSGMSFTDNGTNVVLTATVSGATATNLIDLPFTNLTAFQNNSNYYIDFAFPAAVLTSATNVIAFNYATNWGLATTSRVCNIDIPATNFGRIVTFVNAATNWTIKPNIWFIPLGYAARLNCSLFGSGETNVTVSPFITSYAVTTNTTASFNPTNAFNSAKLWLDASQKVWQDEYLTQPAIEAGVVRGWTDLSGFTTGVTNMTTTALNTTYHSPMLGPENVPCVSIYPGTASATCWLEGPTFTAINQPIWGFVVYYGRSGGNCIDSTSGGRFAINPAEMGQTSSFFCTAGLTYTAAKTVQWTLVSCRGDGANGVMRTNGVQATSGNAGTASPAKWIVFGDNVHAAMVGSFNCAEILILNTNLTATQLTNVESYFYRKYPFWNPPTVQ